ncbi:MAG: electron transport complex subunit RsxE [Christensenellales bacterium]
MLKAGRCSNEKTERHFKNGLFGENPIFRLVLGTCPTIATSTSASNGLGMGLAVTFVLMGSNLVISLLRNFIPNKVRIPAFIVIIATFVTIIQLLIQGFVPALNDSLGLFIPLIVVNCIILARAESFASKNKPLPSVVDGLGMGLGFTGALVIISSIREILGNGTIFGMALFGESFQPVLMMSQAPGGFIVFGLVLAVVNAIDAHSRKKKESVA